MTTYPDEFPKPFSMTRWLCISSCFMLIPGAYAFSRGLFFMSFICVLTAVASFNHWRCAENGYRRCVDKVVAWLCFVFFFLSGCSTTNSYYSYVDTLVILLFVCSSFLLSDYLSVRWNPYWCSTHILFHLFSFLAIFYVVYRVAQKQNMIFDTSFF
jgi:hypothetical protein